MVKGIYYIQNTSNGKLYIGSSIRIEKRLTTHRESLQSGTHPNRYLQRAYNKHGKDAFVYHAFEETNKLLEREQFWVDQFKTCDSVFGYNLRSPDRQSFSKEVCQRIGEKLREYYKTHDNPLKGRTLPKKTRERLSASWDYDKHFTEETIRKMSGANHPFYGKKRPEHSKRMMGANNPFFGRKHTEETRNKMREKWKERKKEG